MRKVFFGQLRAAEMEVNIFLTVLILEKNFYRAFGINWLRVLSNILTCMAFWNSNDWQSIRLSS